MWPFTKRGPIPTHTEHPGHKVMMCLIYWKRLHMEQGKVRNKDGHVPYRIRKDQLKDLENYFKDEYGMSTPLITLKGKKRIYGCTLIEVDRLPYEEGL